MLNRGVRQISVALLLAVLFAACSSDSTEVAALPETAELQVVVLPFLSFGPYFIAEDEGFFADEALDVEFIEMRQSTEAVPALIQGDIDVLAGFINTGLLNAMAQGEDVRLVADKGHLAAGDCTADAFVVRSDLSESDVFATDATVKFSGNPASIEGYLIDRLLAANGRSADDGDLEFIPNPAAELEALQTGAVDIALASEPWITRIEDASAGYAWQGLNQVAPDFQSAGIYFGPNLLTDDRSIGERFMRAYLRGVRQFMEGKTSRNLEILAEATTLEQSVLSDICWNTFTADGSVNVSSIVDFAEWAQGQDLLGDVPTEEMIFDSTFAESASRSIDSES